MCGNKYQCYSPNHPFCFPSIIGGVIVVVGLYLLLWGKEHDESQMKLKEPEDNKAPIFAPSDENNLREEP